MRYLVAMLSCFVFLAVAGPAAGAPVTCVDTPAAMDNAARGEADCGMCPDNGHKCSHDACCGYQVAALSGGVHAETPAALRSPTEAAVVKHLIDSGRDTLLDPPRA